MEYAFLKQPTNGVFHAGIVQSAIRLISVKIKSVTVATHTRPWVIFVRCNEELTSDEHAAVKAIIERLGGD